jgi:hypothetical protein
MEPSDLDDDRPRAARCPQCGELPEWESLSDGYTERWLAVCRCGRMQAFLPDQPAVELDDPLSAFLVGPGRQVLPPTPPWIRLFMRSLQSPWNAAWRYSPEPCAACAERVCFVLQVCPRPYWLARCSLCLACGRVTSEYSQPWQNLHELGMSGSVWAPPSPAVLRLRACVFRPYATFRGGGVDRR